MMSPSPNMGFTGLSELRDKFNKFDKENPRVYELLVKFSRRVRSAGRNYYSIAAIFERVRWHVDIETTGDAFKLNNNHKAFYARKLEAEFPEFRGMFRKRAQKAYKDE